jgi:hypothetical protein
MASAFIEEWEIILYFPVILPVEASASLSCNGIRDIITVNNTLVFING